MVRWRARRAILSAIEAGGWSESDLRGMQARLSELREREERLRAEPDTPADPLPRERIARAWDILSDEKTPVPVRRDALAAVFAEVVWDGERLQLVPAPPT